MMKCPHCGSEVQDTDVFCSNCWNKLNGEVVNIPSDKGKLHNSQSNSYQTNNQVNYQSDSSGLIIFLKMIFEIVILFLLGYGMNNSNIVFLPLIVLLVILANVYPNNILSKVFKVIVMVVFIFYVLLILLALIMSMLFRH